MKKCFFSQTSKYVSVCQVKFKRCLMFAYKCKVYYTLKKTPRRKNYIQSFYCVEVRIYRQQIPPSRNRALQYILDQGRVPAIPRYPCSSERLQAQLPTSQVAGLTKGQQPVSFAGSTLRVSPQKVGAQIRTSNLNL